MSNILSSIGISLLATLILYVLNYHILGKQKTIELGSDGYDYKVSAKHYIKAYILSVLDMACIFIKGTTAWNLFKAVGISILITVGAAFVAIVIGALIDMRSTNEPDEKSFNSMELEIGNAIYEDEKCLSRLMLL